MTMPVRRSELFNRYFTKQAQWKNRVFDCVTGAVDRSKRQFSELTLMETTATARFYLEDFEGETPAVGDRITIDGTVYRILEEHRFPPFLKFALGGEYARN